MPARTIDRVHGIVNGTTNYILTEMARTAADYARGARGRQALGYAETTRPTDVSGARCGGQDGDPGALAFGVPVTLDQVDTRASTSSPRRHRVRREFGLSLKLIGTAERIDGELSVPRDPVFLHADHPLASVDGSYNAVDDRVAA